jgi:hypothetical protein
MMKGRSAKGRKTKRRTKAAIAARGRASKSKKVSKARKTTKAAAKRKTARLQPARKKTARKTNAGRARKEVLGEGNYTAARQFRRKETDFVRRDKDRIPQLGEEAAEALDSSEGNALREAEETARSHAAGED